MTRVRLAGASRIDPLVREILIAEVCCAAFRATILSIEIFNYRDCFAPLLKQSRFKG